MVEPLLDLAVEAGAVAGPAAGAIPGPAPDALLMHEFDPLFGESGFDVASASTSMPPSTWLGDDLPAADTASAFDPSLNFSYDGDDDGLSAGASSVAVAAPSE